MRLVPANAATAVAEAEDLGRLSQLIEAKVPADWPPEILRDAQDVFLAMYREHPDWVGWLHWYGIRADQPESTLCGSVGFMGPPDPTGMIEVGYSVLPAYQRDGIAKEMVAAIVQWASRQPGVTRIEAETTPSNVGSIRVLEANHFSILSEAREPGAVRYCLQLGVPPNSAQHETATSLRSERGS
jgi:RimJ/RimL family protein N-acetyltransferase